MNIDAKSISKKLIEPDCESKSPSNARQAGKCERTARAIRDTSTLLVELAGRIDEMAMFYEGSEPPKVTGIKKNSIVFEDGSSIEFSGGRWRRKGKLIRVSTIQNVFGLSDGYLAGVEDALNGVASNELLNSFSDELAKERLREYAISSAGLDKKTLFFLVDHWDEISRTLLPGNEPIKNLIQNAKLRKAEHSAELARMMTEAGDYAMEDAPSPIESDWPSKPGIYFVWSEGTVVYVGKSRSLKRRLGSHEKIQEGDKVSWLLMPLKEIHFAELFYIWKYRPVRNSEATITKQDSKTGDS